MAKILSRQAFYKLVMSNLLLYLCLGQLLKAQTFAKVQTDSNGSRKVTILVNEVSINEVLRIIKKSTGLSPFMAAQAVSDLNQKVSLDVENERLDNVLDRLLTSKGYAFQFNDNVIVIRKREHEVSPKKNPIDSSIVKPALSGKVTDAEGNPLPGATVMIKGTKEGITTDENGKFVLPKANNTDVLIISSIGYETREIPVKGRSIMAQLNVNVNELDETVVIAYGTTTKRFNTGSVSTVRAEDIEKQPVSNPLLALQGRLPGVTINQATGVSGGYVQVQIRGRNSMRGDNGANDPLYIVDGVQYPATSLLTSQGPAGWANPLSYLNPADIESVDVLKDADATAIYGSRGANGVILITTKKGKAGALRLDVNVYQGAAKVSRKLQLLNTEQYLEMRNEAFKNDGVTPNPFFDYDLTAWDQKRQTDWQKELIGGTAHFTDAQASISGGTVNTTYLISGGYHRETTVYPVNSPYQKASGHFNMTTASTNQKFKVTMSGTYLVNSQNMPSADLAEVAIRLAPNAPALYTKEGHINWENGTFNNPLAYTLSKFKSQTNNFVANASVGYQIFKGLELKTSFGYTNIQTNNITTTPIASNNPAWGVTTGSAAYDESTMRFFMAEPQITYNTSLGDGTLDVLVGSTIQKNQSRYQLVSATGFTNDALLETPQASTSQTVMAKSTLYRYNAIFGRINYNWKGKYLLNLTGRRDGSSRFGPGKRFTNFGAVGAAWIFSQENLFQNVLSWFSFGKVRASYGTAGNDQIGDFQYVQLFVPTTLAYQGVQGLYPNNLLSYDYAWELNRKLEIGLELGFIKDRLLLTANYYRNRSSNQLIGYPLPGITGFGNVTANSPATVQNSGWEISLNSTNIKGRNFSWSSTFNISIPRNKLVAFPDFNNSALANTSILGKSLSTKRLLHMIKVDEESGRFLFQDSKGNSTFEPSYNDDRIVEMNMDPKFYGGFQNSLAYKNFQFDFFLQFFKRNRQKYLYNLLPGFNGYNQPVGILDRWQQKGDVARFQRFNQDFTIYPGIEYANESDLLYGDGSFIRLSNVYLSYQLPLLWRHKLHLNNLKIYLQGQNLFTITGYEGWDPETDRNLPPLRVFTAGIQLSF